jgi:hypothetical protein
VGETVNNLKLTVSKQNLQTDEEYTFRYRIRTNYGWSDGFSPELQARTATIPSQIERTVFEIIDELFVRLSWV